MKSNANECCLSDQRKALRQWYSTPSGLQLQEQQLSYLRQVAPIGYNQRIVQLGWLGWEHGFVDQDRLQNYHIVTSETAGPVPCSVVSARLEQLPIQSDSIDLILMAHTLEFEVERHQVLREMERILKPEGVLLLLGFYPVSLSRLRSTIMGKWSVVPWSGQLIGCRRIFDWLALLNFTTEMSGDFSFYQAGSLFRRISRVSNAAHCTSVGYGIKAIKRRYTMIPLKPAWQSRSGLVPVGAVGSSANVATDMINKSDKE